MAKLRVSSCTVFAGATPRLALSVWGSGPLVVFLHGIGGNRANWDDQLAACAPRFTACAWDARGYGDSDDYDGPLRFADFAADLVRVLDHFGVRRAHLVGLSMGGRIARDFALRHPGRVATLTLANTTAGFDTLSPAARAAFVRDRTTPLRAGETPASLAPALARRLIGPSAVNGAYERLVASLSRLRVAAYLKAVEVSVAEDQGAALEANCAPTHVITSDEDPLYPPASAAAMTARIPGARLSVVRGAGHLSNLEQPARFNEALLGFLEAYRDFADTPDKDTDRNARP